MSWPAVKFVDAPEGDATVRFDMSCANVGVASDGFSLGVPSFDGEPRSIGVDYGYRDMSFTVLVQGTKSAALSALQTLARELLRRENWLLFQLQPSSAPVWYKTYRGQPGSLSIERVYDHTNGGYLADQWAIEVPLRAEGFAYGERETLPAVTISNDPASGTNPCFYKLPAIKGDAPSSLRISVDFSADLNQSEILWAATPAPPSYTTPIVWQIGTGDGLTAGTDTGAAVASAAFSGGSYRPVSFATNAAMATRLTGVAPAAVPSGRYLVFVRAGRSDTSSTFAYRFGYNGSFGLDVLGSATAIMDRAASTATGHTTWVPLGAFSFPKYQNDLIVPGADYVPGWGLQVQRLSGSGAAWLDAIMLVPVEFRDYEAGRALFSFFAGFGPQASDAASYWDGDLEAYTRVTQFGVLDSGLQPAMRGQVPLVYPGQANVLHLLQQTLLKTPFFGTDNSDAISRSATATVSYMPRYLNLRGD